MFFTFSLSFTGPPSPDVIDVQVTQGRSLGIAVYWVSVQGAENYIALTSNGLNCASNYSSYCYITPVECGQNRSVSVTAYNEAGPSSPSQPASYITCEYINHASSTPENTWDVRHVSNFPKLLNLPFNISEHPSLSPSDPCVPDNIWVEEPNPGNCSLRWDSVQLFDYYMAFIKRDDGTERSCNTTQTICPFFCACGYNYLVTVFPYNQAGSSPSANVQNYTTSKTTSQKHTQ